MDDLGHDSLPPGRFVSSVTQTDVGDVRVIGVCIPYSRSRVGSRWNRKMWQDHEESEVLFTLIAERYERRSLGITSNLVFSEWERIFANPMATAAAIDRVVHHSVILEFDVPSYRTDAAQQRGHAEEVNRQN